MCSWWDPLTDEERKEADALAERLRELGFEPHFSRVHQAVLRNEALVATHVLAQRIWFLAADDVLRDPREWWAYANKYAEEPDDPRQSYLRPAFALRRLLAGGADPRDLRRVVQEIVANVLDGVMQALAEGRDPTGPGDLPGWRVMEMDATGELTGRALGDFIQTLAETIPDAFWELDDEKDADGESALPEQ